MADFPRSIPVHMESTERTLDAALVSRSRAGRIRLRRMFAAPVKEFVVQFHGLTDAQRNTVQSFLIANRKLPFNFYWPYGGGVHQVVWTDSAIEWTDEGANLSAAAVLFAVAN